MWNIELFLFCHDILPHNHQFCSDGRSCGWYKCSFFFPQMHHCQIRYQGKGNLKTDHISVFLPFICLLSFGLTVVLYLKISVTRLLPLLDIWDNLWFVTKLDAYSSSLVWDCIMCSFLCHPCGKSLLMCNISATLCSPAAEPWTPPNSHSDSLLCFQKWQKSFTLIWETVFGTMNDACFFRLFHKAARCLVYVCSCYLSLDSAFDPWISDDDARSTLFTAIFFFLLVNM